MIEVIEHMYPDTLNNCIKTVFEKIAPRIVLITTPNSDFNRVFDDMTTHSNLNSCGDHQSKAFKFRHPDHKFEFSRIEFQDWCQKEILDKYTDYVLVDKVAGVGEPPCGYEDVGKL
jgi:hypothetical protein